MSRHPRNPLLTRTLALALLLLAPAGALRADLPPLIPRDVLFGNPEKVSPQISPDGKRLAWIAPDDKNVLQVWVKTVGKRRRQGRHRRQEARHPPVPLGREQQDPALPAGRRRRRELPRLRRRPRPAATSATSPPSRACARTSWPPTRPSPTRSWSRSTCATGRPSTSTASTSTPATLVLDTENPGDVVGWAADPKFQVRAAQVATPDGGTEIRIRDDEQGRLEELDQGRPGGDPRLPGLHRRRQVGHPHLLDRQRHRAGWSSASIATGAEKVAGRLARGRRGRARDPPRRARRAGRRLRARPQPLEGDRPLGQGGLRGHRQAPRRRLLARQPRQRRRHLAGRLHLRPRADPLLLLGPRGEEGDVPLRPPAEARGPAAAPR